SVRSNPVALTRSPKNSAPRDSNAVSSAFPVDDSGSVAGSTSGRAARQISPRSRRNNAIGVLLTGPTFLFRVPTSAFRVAVNLPQAISPERHNPSSQSGRSEEHTSELQSLRHLVCRLLLEKKNNKTE